MLHAQSRLWNGWAVLGKTVAIRMRTNVAVYSIAINCRGAAPVLKQKLPTQLLETVNKKRPERTWQHAQTSPLEHLTMGISKN